MLHDDRIDCLLQNDSNWPTYLNTESNWKCRFDLHTTCVHILYVYVRICMLQCSSMILQASLHGGVYYVLFCCVCTNVCFYVCSYVHIYMRANLC